MDGGSEGRVLDFGVEEGGRSWGLGWKEADELECFGMGTVARDAVFFGDGFVEGGGNIEQPRVAKL